MMNLISKEMFKTSMGTAFIVDSSSKINVGDDIIINGTQYKIKKIIEHSRPTDFNSVAIFV